LHHDQGARSPGAAGGRCPVAARLTLQTIRGSRSVQCPAREVQAGQEACWPRPACRHGMRCPGMPRAQYRGTSLAPLAPAPARPARAMVRMRWPTAAGVGRPCACSRCAIRVNTSCGSPTASSSPVSSSRLSLCPTMKQPNLSDEEPTFNASTSRPGESLMPASASCEFPASPHRAR
jgi:hypothetical protein